jgi:hypothetical protein
MSSDQQETSNAVEFPMVRGSTTRFFRLDMLVLDVLTPLIGFENGSYALHLAGYQHLGDIATSSPEEISRVAGMSPPKIRKIKSFLRKHDLDFGADTTDWQSCRMPKIFGRADRHDHRRKPIPAFLSVVR